MEKNYVLTVKQAAEKLQLSTTSIYRLCGSGELSSSKINRKILIKEDDIEKLLEKKKRQTSLQNHFFLETLLTNTTQANIDKAKGGQKMARSSRSRQNYGYGSVYKRTKGKSWVIDYRDNGKRIQKAVPGADTKAEAIRVLRREISKVYRRRIGWEQDKQKMGFRDFAEIYLQDYAKTEKDSWKTDEYRLRKMKDYFRDTKLRSITPLKIREFKAVRLKEGIAKTTTNREIALLKKMFNIAIEEGYLEDNPVKKIKMFSEQDSIRDRVLLPEEEPRLYANLAEHAKPVCLLGQYAGLRSGEALNLEWRNVVLRGVRNSYIKVEKAKSKKARKIPINSILFDLLTKLRASRGNSKMVFPFKSIRTAFENACKRAEIEDFTFHDLRRTFGTRLLEKGMNIVTISKLYGHSSVLVTQRYLHPQDELSIEAVELLVEKPFGDNLVTKVESEQSKKFPVSSSLSVN